MVGVDDENIKSRLRIVFKYTPAEKQIVQEDEKDEERPEDD
jgi:hypothetical protein